MSTLTFPELDELEGKIKNRQDEMGKVFAEGIVDGVLDLSKVKSLSGTNPEKAAQVKAWNDELTDLATQAEPLRAIRAAAAAAKRAEDAGRDEDIEFEYGDGARSKDRDRSKVKSLGRAMAEAGLLKNGAKGEIADFDIRAMIKNTLFETATGWAPETTRGPRFVDYPNNRTNILDLIPTTTTRDTAVKYMEETTFTNNAAEVAEGAEKPEAVLAVTERTEPVAKIAVTIPVTDEQFDDEPRAEAYVNRRLARMVVLRLAGQVVVGNGTSPNLSGFLDRAIQTQAKGSDPIPDAVYKAMTKVRVTGEAEPDGYVTHPNDWQEVRLLRTADGIYIWGNPSEAGPEMIWGLRVALVPQITEGTGLVGDFGNYSELAIRKGITVDTGYVNNQFRENKKTVRAEMRAALLVFRTSAFASVTGI